VTTFRNNTICHECNLGVMIDGLQQGQKASCPRCAYVLTRVHRNAVSRMAVFSATAVCALIFSNLFTFISLTAQGQERSLTLPQSIIALCEHGDWLLAAITFAVVIALPLTFSIALHLLMFDIRTQQISARTQWLWKTIVVFRFWNMAEIYFLGVLVSIIKVVSLADVGFGPSFWFFCVFSIAQIATLLHLDTHQISQRIGGTEPPKGAHEGDDGRASLQRTALFLLTGLLLYIPANLLPIMTVTTLGNPEANTIIGGVVTLWEHGSYPIAGIIFIASVLVPIGKFLVLLSLLLSEHFRVFRRPGAKITVYRVTEFVGRWSMVDVFVVAFLAALVQFGNVMAIQPGPAVLAFAGMVVATMLAADSFEPKIFWHTHERS
jgi:paraquat-inducible protein A